MSEVLQRADGTFYDPDRLPIEIVPFANLACMGVDVYIKRGRRFVTALEWTDTDEGSMEPSPAIRLDYDNAQALMNNLWKQGYRPNPSLTGEDRLGAMNNHLQDMRQIAFNTLEIEQPKKGG